MPELETGVLETSLSCLRISTALHIIKKEAKSLDKYHMTDTLIQTESLS